MKADRQLKFLVDPGRHGLESGGGRQHHRLGGASGRAGRRLSASERSIDRHVDPDFPSSCAGDTGAPRYTAPIADQTPLSEPCLDLTEKGMSGRPSSPRTS